MTEQKKSENGQPCPPITKSDIRTGAIDGHLGHINHEFRDGFEFLEKYPKSVTVFGSSMAKPEDESYKMAVEIGKRVSSELGYAVITGGGPGIMEAANKGSYEAGGTSLGLNISIPHERTTNAYVTHAIKFSYFFSRKVMLSFAAEAYIFMPGGFGTFDELFGILTLIQTGKIPRVPIILCGSKFWNPLEKFMKETMLKGYHAIDKDNFNLFEITDSVDRVMEIIRIAPVSEWWRNIN